MEKTCETCMFGFGAHTVANICSQCIDYNKWMCPSGVYDGNPKFHGRFESLGQEIGQLTDEKNKAYGDMLKTANPVMAILYPDGISSEQRDDALLIVRIVDKLSRIARGDKKAFGESPWRDICGYGLIGAMRDKEG